MNLTYEQFINIVPKETAEFVDLALPYLERYLKEERNLKFRKTDIESENYYSKATMLLCYCLDQNKKYSTFLGRCGFESSRLKLEMEKIPFDESKSVMFEHYGSIFTIYNDLTLYKGLQPLDIVNHVFTLYKSKCDTSLFSELFPGISLYKFSKSLESLSRIEKEEIEHQIEKVVYGNTPISIVSYLETATKIRTLLFNHFIDNKSEIVSCTEEDIVPLSLLLSLYYSEENKQTEEEITEQIVLQEYLKEKGITIEGINKAINFTISNRIISEQSKNVYSLSLEYQRYLTEGINNGISQSEITLANILTNLFNRNFTNSLVIEKIFAKQNCYMDDIEPLEDAVAQLKEKKRLIYTLIHVIYSLKHVKYFYSELSKQTIDFIEFTGKTYILILEKMKNGEHNIKYLMNEDDVDTLALYIATSYYGGDVDEFFKDHGVTLDKILKLLNLSITKEEIEETELNKKVLVDRFKRFVYEGVNRNKSARNITIDDISHNLCNRQFNRTMILENLFDDITDKIDLDNDFFSQLKMHLVEKEKIRKRKLSQKLFCDMPAESIEYMEIVSKVHQWLKKQNIPYSERDICSFSLLIATFFILQTEVQYFFESKGITYDKICSILNISKSGYSDTYDKICSILNISKSGYSDMPVDIDLLIEQYGIYIFGGANKNLERKELTILNISKNIFSKEINNSIGISRFLAHFHLNYDFFDNFEQNYQQYLEETERTRKSIEAEGLLSKYSRETSQYIRNILRIHQRIASLLQIKENEKFHNKYDIISLSFILGLFTVDNDIRYFFLKNGLTLENILSQLNLNLSILENLEEVNYDYSLLLEQYKPLLIQNDSKYYDKKISDVGKTIFEPSFCKESSILEELCNSIGANYSVLKQEVETEMDYELSLAIEDRISLLSTTDVDTLNLDDIKSILQFGNSLSVHSKYIHDELPKLMMEDAHDTSIETINQIIERVYTKEETSKKRGFFAQLFSLSIEEEKPKLVINHEAVEELKDAIEHNITSLSKELVGYDSIRKYIEVYRKKNRSHLLIVNGEVKRMEEKVGSLNPENEEEYDGFLQATSQLQIMRDKANRFNTSNHLMKQELLKVNQAIVNHFITINALEMARDDLFPLIGSELALTKGRQTENQALDLSKNVIELFQSLLTRNVDGAVQNMEKLKQSSLPESVYQVLNQDIETYVKGINQATTLTSRIESSEVNPVDSSSYKSTLSLENPSLDFYQKKLEKKNNNML